MIGRKGKARVRPPWGRDGNKGTGDSFLARKHGWGSAGFCGWYRLPGRMVLFLVLLGVMISCAPVTLYSVDLKYQPSKTGEGPAAGKNEKVVLMLDEFADTRQVPDRMIIGAVVKDDGSRIRIFPKYARPAEAVTAMVKDYLSRAGYTVIASAGATVDQQAKVRKDPAGVVVGGEINELEITCQDSFAVKKYSSRVKLTVHLSDAGTGNGRYKVSAESGSTLEHYRFSEEMLAGQINDALSDAVAKIFEGEEMGRRIRGVTVPSR